MARSAAQRAARRLKRLMRPSFQFKKLPAELQLLILCECDLVSLGRLLKVSPDVRALCLQCPKTAAQDILKQVPQPAVSLLRVAWALHNVKREDFDPENALRLLRHHELHEWSNLFPQLFAVNDDPLDCIRGLVDLYVEVDVAADLVAQGMNAAMVAFVNPQVVIAPIELSETEHIRIMCALLVVRIYYQLRSKFGLVQDIDTPAHEFPHTFIRSLKPWQIEQAVYVEGFVDVCLRRNAAYLYQVINSRYRCMECLSAKSSYFRKYRQVAIADDLEPMKAILVDLNRRTIHRRPVSFSVAASIRNHPTIQPPWNYIANNSLSSEDSHPITQLHIDGWLLYNSIGQHGHLRFSRMFLSLGLFFWDQDRLASWDLVSLSDIKWLHSRTGKKLEYWSWLMDFESGFFGCRCCHSGTYCDKLEARQVKEWTRSPVQRTMEEYLHRKTAPLRVADGYKPVPEKYMETAVFCRFCWLEGHQSHRCAEESWSDNDDDGVPSPSRL